ncbi:RNA polymerase subunit sigma-70 [Prauserella marina]|uniref:RNA polymerase sigma-70 factor, ECF subfamily n=1 Tax=Prauserella marina TaxID=530584 RepID=A0A222VZ40_9PSEU|nr:RNA polymerase subunit sigma-70 [Prauserella marina]PWV84535.1 RNA polymerase ECF family sigma subunit [Prauserella marina]SDC19872.1 RNA polymerase sigma-70 factor, ECF subfamily [Prauserella marina]
MTEEELLAARFEEQRPRLRAVAMQVLGSSSDADDAVQEAWLRLSRTGATAVNDLAAWLTTVVARVSLNILRSRGTRREQPLPEEGVPRRGFAEPSGAAPEDQAVLADSVGLALLVVLDTLGPAERLAFVLHDLFGVPFEDIAPIVERSPAATRKLASRARRRVRGATVAGEKEAARRDEIVTAFLAAARGGDFDALLRLLAPDAVLRTDPAAARAGASAATGARDVARGFTGRVKAARLALVDGLAGLIWVSEGRLRVVFTFAVAEGKITAIDVVADDDRLARLDVRPLER